MVSIHPMCRFKLLTDNIVIGDYLVSIHPMCRFKFYSSTTIAII